MHIPRVHFIPALVSGIALLSPDINLFRKQMLFDLLFCREYSFLIVPLLSVFPEN